MRGGLRPPVIKFTRGNKMASATVTVACKLVHGLIAQLYKFVDTPTGRMAQADGKPVTLKGGNDKYAVAGWGITENVDRSFMEQWLKDNMDMTAVKDGFIIVRDNREKAVGEAEDKADKKTGLEPLDPDAPPAGIEAIPAKKTGRK